MGKDYKQIDFNDKNDYLFVFYNLISKSYQMLRRYKKYLNNLNHKVSEIEQQNLTYIDVEIYEEWHDKIIGVSRGLITTFVDDAKGAISYIRLRKIMEKSKYPLPKLDDVTKKNLDELRDVRNWSYHDPMTNIVAMKEVFMKNFPKEFQQYLVYSFNPLRVGIPDQCSVEFFKSLYMHNELRRKSFDIIFDRMIKDFEYLLGEKVTIVEVAESPLELHGDEVAVSQLSMAMNRRKYDGSDKSYEEITHQQPFNKQGKQCH